MTWAPGGTRQALRKAVLARDGHRCLKCQATENLTLDHVVPRALGGTNDKDNLQTLCLRCNFQKGSKSRADYRGKPARKPLSHNERVLRLLSDGKAHSFMELYRLNVIAHSRVAELRKRGHKIVCWREKDDYFYRLESAA